MYTPAIDAMIEYAIHNFPPTHTEEIQYSHKSETLYEDDLVNVTLQDGVLSIGAVREGNTVLDLTDEEYLAIRKVANRLFDFFGKRNGLLQLWSWHNRTAKVFELTGFKIAINL